MRKTDLYRYKEVTEVMKILNTEKARKHRTETEEKTV